MLPARFARRPWRVLLATFLLFFFLYSLSHRGASPSGAGSGGYRKTFTKPRFPPPKSPSKSVPPDYCENFPKGLLDDVQVVLKTGAGDSKKNKEAHLSTVTSCITNLLIVSDHEEQIGDHHVVDILAELPASYAVNSTDFQAYAQHKKAHAEGDRVSYSREGWRLDRFKFLPMVDKAYQVAPKAKWYVFLETDVYFFWDTLFRQLDQLDANDAHYMGSPAAGSNNDGVRWYAYGGAGFVLSQGLMKKLIPTKPTTAAAVDADYRLSVRYEDWAKNDCCGDAVLAYAIYNATSVKMEALNPTFAGDELKKIIVDRDRWCVPLLSIHRMSPDQMDSLWKWERTRPYTQKPFVYSSLLAYTHAHLRDGASREFWDNLSEAPVPNDRPAHRGADSCGHECAADPHCLQWSYSQTVCRFANYIKLGNPVDPENGGQGEFTSGWDLGKMGELGFKVDAEHNMHDTCVEATWVTPQVKG